MEPAARSRLSRKWLIIFNLGVVLVKVHESHAKSCGHFVAHEVSMRELMTVNPSVSDKHAFGLTQVLYQLPIFPTSLDYIQLQASRERSNPAR